MNGCLVDGCTSGHYALGLCLAHYWRVKRHGDTDLAPKTGEHLARVNRERGWARVEDYQWLREDVGMTREAAMQRLGICERTAYRYEKRLREAGNRVAA